VREIYTIFNLRAIVTVNYIKAARQLARGALIFTVFIVFLNTLMENDYD
jgi:hypothetical protein